MNEIEKELNKTFLLQEEYGGQYKEINRTIPWVSVTVATYQHAPYIKECLEGILMQKTSFPIEIIIGEDGSTDGTREICTEYAEKYPDKIRLFLRDRNLSQFHTSDGQIVRFNGLWNRMSCRGKYIAICEGDDYWTDPLKLQKQVDFLEENSDYGLVHTDFTICNSGKFLVSKRKHVWASGDILNILLFGTYNIGTLTSIFRKSVYDNLPKHYLKQNFKMGDLPLWIELSRISKIKYLRDITAAYRVTDNSASHSEDIEKEIAFILSLYEVKQYYSTLFGMVRDSQKDNFDFKCRVIKLAYLKNNSIVARKYYSEIKNTQYTVPLKTKVFYWGTRFFVIKYLIQFLYKLQS